MMLVRPINLKDLDYLYSFAASASTGLTTLPKDQEYLQKKILASLKAFASPSEKKHGDTYLFVLEDCLDSSLVGVCGILPKVGLKEPFYTYRLKNEKQHSPSIKTERNLQVLYPTTIKKNCSEICSLFLMPQYRKGGFGRLLSFSRFLFIALHPKRFEDTIIAEMRGVSNREGYSPLWNNLGRHFFAMSFEKANQLSSKNKQFVQDLIPTHPIYVNLLPQKAQNVIGKPHPHTIPAYKLLKREGFQFNGYLDIFDGGPAMQAKTKDIRCIRECLQTTVGKIKDHSFRSRKYFLSNRNVSFRACMANASIHRDNTVSISAETAKILHVKIGSPLCCVTVYPS